MIIIKNNLSYIKSLEEESKYNSDSDNEPLDLRKEKLKIKITYDTKLWTLLRTFQTYTNKPSIQKTAMNWN